MKEAIRRLRENDGLSLKRTADMLIEEAVRLTGSKIGYFATLNKWEHLLTMIAWSKGAMAMCSMANKPIVYPVESTGLWGDCVRERKAVITNDYKNCTRPTKKGIPEGHTRVLRHMNVPMMSGNSIKGVLGLATGRMNTRTRSQPSCSHLPTRLGRLLRARRSVMRNGACARSIRAAPSTAGRFRSTMSCFKRIATGFARATTMSARSIGWRNKPALPKCPEVSIPTKSSALRKS